MRAVADRRRIEAFLAALAREAITATNVVLVGGTTAVLAGWRASTIDIDLVIKPKSDGMLRAIPALKSTSESSAPAAWRRSISRTTLGTFASGDHRATDA